MEKLYSHIVGTPVFEDDLPRPFTTVKDIVMDPERGKLIAFVVHVAKNRVIAPIDVVYWKEVVKVNDRGVVVKGKEILRVEEVQKNGIRFMHNKVETEDGKVLGKVINFAVDNKTYELRSLLVAKSVLGFIRYDTKIVKADQIVEVLPEKIVVKSDLKTVKEEAKSRVSMEDVAVG